MKKIKVTHLAQLASYRTATEILRTVITECDKMSWNEIERCIESVAVDELSVRIKAHFSDNKNVQPKIRQQLQILRDRGFLKFTARGHYKKVK